ncbi:hypothetical protein [Geobacter sp. SVR]|uniref:hypothetical protein n=1 Tax=Geobacter sp. SVR TaxID=2495594 RepID=UPI00143F0144|nr:hypothetical protein [Geobacter sp. SVR]BCS55065.1 hypothetical protein GSVR_33730 [Geobacter sp. SVR]GCF85247.1 hypothetical protein GSbR_18470 [Geobacter sp. SVR]
MNKIKLLYDVTRAMRNQKKISGVLQAQIRKDQEEIVSLRNTFETGEAGKTRITASSELNLDNGHVTRESTTEFDFPGHDRPGCGMLHRLFQRHHGSHGCCGIRGLFGKLSLVFGILSSLKVEEKGDGAAVISLDLDELPDELSKMFLDKMQYKNDCLAHHGFLKEHLKAESLNGTLVVTVNRDRIIETITINATSAARDENDARHTMAADAEVRFA